MALPEPIGATLSVTTLLERLNIPYFIAGSLASTVHGEVRTTQDSDVVAEITPSHVEAFVTSAEKLFFVDGAEVSKAIQEQTSFNLIHRESFFRVDVFIPQKTDFNASQLERARSELIVSQPQAKAYIATAEDTILAKLNWFQASGGTSQRQWNDVIGIIKIQAERLDHDYMSVWAEKLGLSQLLNKALNE